MSKVGNSWSFVCFIGIGSTTKALTEVAVKKLFMWRYEEASQAESQQPSWGLLFDEESNANKQKWQPAMDYDIKIHPYAAKADSFPSSSNTETPSCRRDAVFPVMLE